MSIELTDVMGEVEVADILGISLERFREYVNLGVGLEPEHTVGYQGDLWTRQGIQQWIEKNPSLVIDWPTYSQAIDSSRSTRRWEKWGDVWQPMFPMSAVTEDTARANGKAWLFVADNWEELIATTE